MCLSINLWPEVSFATYRKLSTVLITTFFLTKLEFWGITGVANKLIKSYLEGRY